MQDAYFSCGALDVIAIRAYSVGDFETLKLKTFVDKANNAVKNLIIQEWGVCYTDSPNNNCHGGSPIDYSARDHNICTWASQIDAAGIPVLLVDSPQRRLS